MRANHAPKSCMSKWIHRISFDCCCRMVPESVFDNRVRFCVTCVLEWREDVPRLSSLGVGGGPCNLRPACCCWWWWWRTPLLGPPFSAHQAPLLYGGILRFECCLQQEGTCFQLQETCFQLEETCFPLWETCFHMKETCFR